MVGKRRSRLVGFLAVVWALSLLWSCSLRHSSSPEQALLGDWVGKNKKGQQVRIRFLAGSLFLAGVGTDFVSGSYKVDFSRKPAALDLNVKGVKPIHTIIELLGNDHIRIEPTDPGKPRPTGFSASAVIYTRNTDQDNE